MESDVLDRCFSASLPELKALMPRGFQLAREAFSDQIYFFLPGMYHYDTSFYTALNPYRFPSVSITGGRCHLQCEHCRGRLLEQMIPATTPERLYQVCRRVKEEGGRGCLISGGSDSWGSVPLIDYIPVLKRVKRGMNLDLVVHTGVIHPWTAESLSEVGIDAAMFDIVGSNETLRDICHLDLTVDGMEESLSILESKGIPVAPHLLVGLHHGRLNGEKRAVEVLSRHRLAAAVIIAFMPLDQTPMASATPPPPEEIARVVLASRLLLPDTPLVLGCARPRGDKPLVDILAIEAGVNGIAYPSEEGYRYARRRGLTPAFSERCCSLIYKACPPGGGDT